MPMLAKVMRGTLTSSRLTLSIRFKGRGQITMRNFRRNRIAMMTVDTDRAQQRKRDHTGLQTIVRPRAMLKDMGMPLTTVIRRQ